MKENEGQRRMRVGRRREKIRLQGIREEIRRKKKKKSYLTSSLDLLGGQGERGNLEEDKDGP